MKENYQQIIKKSNIEGEKEYFLKSVVGRYQNKYALDLVRNLRRDSKILNVGDGTGTISLEMELLGFRNITGIDVNNDCLSIAKKRCKFTKFKYGDAHNLPFKDKSFDAVTYVDVIELLNPKKH